MMRTGLIAQKLGMSRVFNKDGTNVPVTLLQIDNCNVIEKKTKDIHGYDAVRISFGLKKKNKIGKMTKGFFTKIKSEPCKLSQEFRVSSDGFLDVGTKVSVNHFVKGQFVDISGFTIGKGFAGGMKRHNFAGNRASHGVSISHRSHGSTGQCQDPGKVFKGKKMAGRLGNVKRTMQNIEVISTDDNDDLIIVKGSVPGPRGLYVTISDSVKIKNKNLPFPTFISNEQDSATEIKNEDFSIDSSKDKSLEPANADGSKSSEVKDIEKNVIPNVEDKE